MLTPLSVSSHTWSLYCLSHTRSFLALFVTFTYLIIAQSVTATNLIIAQSVTFTNLTIAKSITFTNWSLYNQSLSLHSPSHSHTWSLHNPSHSQIWSLHIHKSDHCKVCHKLIIAQSDHCTFTNLTIAKSITNWSLHNRSLSLHSPSHSHTRSFIAVFVTFTNPIIYFSPSHSQTSSFNGPSHCTIRHIHKPHPLFTNLNTSHTRNNK